MLQLPASAKNTQRTSLFALSYLTGNSLRAISMNPSERLLRRPRSSKDHAKRRTMTHRSNQAVASQGQPAPHTPDEGSPQRRRRFLIGWTTALAALGVSTAAVALVLWLVRIPIATFMLNAALAERGAEADFEIVNLDFGGIVLREVRFGAESRPDLLIERVESRWGWMGLAPRLQTIHVISPRVRIALTREGRVSLGALERIRSTPSPRRFRVPAIELKIEDGVAAIAAPFGDLAATFEGAGRLGTDFRALARIEESSRSSGAYALDAGAAELLVQSLDDNISFQLAARVNELVWSGVRARDAQLQVNGSAPLDLAQYGAEATWRIGALRTDTLTGDELSGTLQADGVAQQNALIPAAWQGGLALDASHLTLESNTFAGLHLTAAAQGAADRGEANWRLAAQRFDGLSLVSEQPSADGALAFDLGRSRIQGDARVALARSQLDAEAQRRIRAAFPNLGAVPIGPTFAQAERALDAAADRFDLTLPLTLTGEENALRLTINTLVEARAATGARLRLAPLRRDAPALVLQWPGPALHGAMSLELSGGGAPHASLLLDSADWSRNAPFEADGTLTLSEWRAQGASIAANELGVTIAVSNGGAGRIDLRGPIHVTGPVGNGQVRDLAPDLDIAIEWKPGWRVTPNRGCLPTRMAGLDAAGLSFSNGAFALCALDNVLIASNANEMLSGGFVVRDLALNGRMAGPSAQPAQLTSAAVTGRFGGRVGDMLLALEADAPRLAIAMDEGRTLSVVLHRLTANAFIADNWRIAGSFESGTLTDPSLPGDVSTIEGAWSAAPEDGEAVIRVASGSALLTANRPDNAEQRPLFNPIELSQVNAILRGGRLDANGDLLLDEANRQIATFTAWHDMADGVGAAHVDAPSIVFSEALQPYEITERARGVIENVRGPVAAVADITWSRSDIASTGRLRLDGVSFATTTLPIVQDVRGEVEFDDLFALTTPPGQQVSVGLLNPGIAVTDGRLRFQLLPEQRIAIEAAAFNFAGGQLAMRPTTVTLGQSETLVVLTLADVDAASLIASLNVPDLSATGRLEGSFPLRLTARTAYVENGVLRALPGGGTLAYTGDAGLSATGVTRVAFDALRGFRYDELALRLNGDISGEVLTEIEFSGENTGRPVELGSIAPVPGLGNVSVRGVPFDFNVRITAPFRRLAQTAASIIDPGQILDRANEGANVDVEVEVEENSPVDLQPPGTR